MLCHNNSYNNYYFFLMKILGTCIVLGNSNIVWITKTKQNTLTMLRKPGLGKSRVSVGAGAGARARAVAGAGIFCCLVIS